MSDAAAAQPAAGNGARPAGLAARGAAIASLLLLLAINLFNYVDRQVLSAVEPEIRRQVLHEPAAAAEADVPTTPPPVTAHAKTRTGILASAFIISYVLASPIFGWLADRVSRWLLIGVSV